MMTDEELRKNEEAAERYYSELEAAVERRDWKVMMESDPPDSIDWTQLPSPILEKYDEIYGQIGELYLTEIQGKEL